MQRAPGPSVEDNIREGAVNTSTVSLGIKARLCTGPSIAPLPRGGAITSTSS